MSRSRTTAFACVFLAGSAMSFSAGSALGQVTPDSLKLPGDAPAVTGQVTKAGTMRLMSRPMTIDFTDTRLEDAIKFITEFTGAEIETHWADGNSEGLDKDFQVTMKIKSVPALQVLERLLEKAKGDFSENTWQMTDVGTLECGPKSVLNRSKRLEIYDIHDLLFEIERYDEVPQIDLQSLLQQSQGGGGGGGQSPFRDDQQDRQRDRMQLEERARMRAEDLVALITSLVESEQWSDSGGDGGTIRLYQKSIIVNAPDYMHRAIDGYKWWGQGYKAYKVADRRYVSLNMGVENGTIDGIRNFPVSAVVGGRVISSDPSRNPPGGGGNKAPADKNKKPASKKPAAKPDAKKPDAKKPEPKK
ncbi:MAG: hypothetical protein AB7G11_03080 [Phycisphaerales bacterium]